MGYNPNSPELGDLKLSKKAIEKLDDYFSKEGDGKKKRHYFGGEYFMHPIRIADPNGDHVHGLHPVDALLEWRMTKGKENRIRPDDLLYLTRYAVHKGFKRMMPRASSVKAGNGDEETQIRFDNHRRPAWRKGFRAAVLERAFEDPTFYRTNADPDSRFLLCAVKSAQPDLKQNHYDPNTPYIYPDAMFDKSHPLHKQIMENWVRLREYFATHKDLPLGQPAWDEIKHMLPERVVERALKQRARELGKHVSELEYDEYKDIHPLQNGGGHPWLPEMNFDHHAAAANMQYYGLDIDTDWASLRDYYKGEAEIFGMGALVGYYLRQLADDDAPEFYRKRLPVADNRERKAAISLAKEAVSAAAMPEDEYRYRWMYDGHAVYHVPDALKDAAFQEQLLMPLAKRLLGKHATQNIDYIDYVGNIAAMEDPYAGPFYKGHPQYSASFSGMDIFLDGVHAGMSWHAMGTRIHPDVLLRNQKAAAADQVEEDPVDTIPTSGMTFYDLSRVIDFKFRKRLTDLYHMKDFISLAEGAANAMDGSCHERVREDRKAGDVEWNTWRYFVPSSGRMQPEMLQQYIESAHVRRELEIQAINERHSLAPNDSMLPHDIMLAMESIYESNHRVARTVK
ncbi:hypothetical protein GC177_08260 [bacterium]|nr:hypothetical protein [bacterium]